jgi:hypothetical protein
MAATIITKEDLIEFKEELLNELRDIISPNNKPATENGKQWLKTFEVKKMLGVSPGTLQALRLNGTIAYSKVGGLIFYSYEDILKLMKPEKQPVRSLRTGAPRRPMKSK